MKIDIISSKSDAHRAFICSAIAEIQGGKATDIKLKDISLDVERTAKALEKIKAASLSTCNDKSGRRIELFVGESGSSLRFILPVVSALGISATFKMNDSLSKRPIDELLEVMTKNGAEIHRVDKNTIEVDGKLKAGIYELENSISSQFISGLIMALPLLAGKSEIRINSKLESEDYVNMTIDTLSKFGVKVMSIFESDHASFSITGSQKFIPLSEYVVEGDWSNAGFWFAAAVLSGKNIAVKGLQSDSKQADRRVLGIIETMGGSISRDKNGVIASAETLTGIDVDVSRIPDLAPVIALMMSVAEGRSSIVNAYRLKFKESDRLNSISCALNALGSNVVKTDDELVISGVKSLRGGEVDSFNDHRIAMMVAIASIVCDEKVILKNSSAVKKSYPGFFDELKKVRLDFNLEAI